MQHTQHWLKHAPQSVTTGILVWLLLLLGSMLLTKPSMAADTSIPSSSAALERLQIFLDNLQTLEADFVQRVVEPEAGVPATSRGHITTARPNRFRWDYHIPTEQTIVSDGQKIWFYEPDLQQVTIGNTSQLDNTPALLLSSGTQIPTLFTWEILMDAMSNLPSVRLFPKKNGTIQEIVLTMHPKRNELLKLTTSDSMGHTSHFSFHNMRINQSVSKERFQFEIPANVDIIQDYSKSSDPS